MEIQANEEDQEYEKLCSDFIGTNKGLIVAPAGYGKTHSITELLLTKHSGKILILTHTHAGIASIKAKLEKQSIPPSRYNLETISGYSQKYTTAYTQKEKIPNIEDTSKYYPFIYNRMLELLAHESIQQVIKSTYTNVVVDEYQDCTAKQHQMVLQMSEFIPVHVLGDGMQGIFNFEQNLVSWEVVEKDFTLLGELKKPWRWVNSGNELLGQDIANMREVLTNKLEVKLTAYTNVEYLKVNSTDQNELYKNISNVLNGEDNVLIIEADSANRTKRLNLVKKFSGRLHMLESVDDKSFYETAKIVDSISTDFYKNLLLLIKGEVGKSKSTRKGGLMTGLSSLLKDGDKPAKSRTDNSQIEVYNLVVKLIGNYDLQEFKHLLIQLKQLKDVRTPSRELYTSLMNAIDLAIAKELSVYDAMVEVRNNSRRVGRKLYGKVIGTTLLTKGLEMDCVVIIDAHKIPDDKNFYVAISRATKRLVILSDKETLNFFANKDSSIIKREKSSDSSQLTFDFQ